MEARVIKCNKQSSRDQRMRQLMREFVSRMKDKVPDTASPSNPQSLNYNSSPTSPTEKSNKRALLCGVSYVNSKYKLRGTINDVRIIRDLLIDKFKFPKECIRVLTEEEPEQKFTPTKVNIQDSLKWLVEGCNSGDSLVFYFAGHGIQQLDFEGDELDGLDETICPVDFMTEGMILDNELNSTIIRPLKNGVKLHAIVDACHSGSILDLSYVYNKKEKKWEDFIPLPLDKNTSGGLAICISACKDDEEAVDTSGFPRNTLNGALTYTFIEVVKRHSGLTYGDLLDLMHEAIEEANQQGCLTNARTLRKMFHGKLIQKPILSSSERFDVYSNQFEL